MAGGAGFVVANMANSVCSYVDCNENLIEKAVNKYSSLQHSTKDLPHAYRYPPLLLL